MSDKNISLSYPSLCLLRAINFWRPPVYFWLPPWRKNVLVGSYWCPTTSCDRKWTSYLSHPENGVVYRRLIYVPSCKHAHQTFLQPCSLVALSLCHLVPRTSVPWDPARTSYVLFALHVLHLAFTSLNSHDARSLSCNNHFFHFFKSGKETV